MTVSLTTHQQLRTWAEEFAAVDGRDRSCW